MCLRDCTILNCLLAMLCQNDTALGGVSVSLVQIGCILVASSSEILDFHVCVCFCIATCVTLVIRLFILVTASSHSQYEYEAETVEFSMGRQAGQRVYICAGRLLYTHKMGI